VLSVALTGNAGAGKSTVARWFKAWGATVIDADELVRELQAPGSPVLARIVERFGPECLLADGSLDRARLRRLILEDPAARRALDAIVHPAVEARHRALLAEAQARGDAVVVSDIPLLFEAARPEAFDVVILVDAPEPVRRQRLLERGLSAEEVDRLMAAQWPSERKRPRSHIVLDNSGTLEDLQRAARVAWEALQQRVKIS
jgi:dephospho-CoA kinase